jgi:hypothetical protein
MFERDRSQFFSTDIAAFLNKKSDHSSATLTGSAAGLSATTTSSTQSTLSTASDRRTILGDKKGGRKSVISSGTNDAPVGGVGTSAALKNRASRIIRRVDSVSVDADSTAANETYTGNTLTQVLRAAYFDSVHTITKSDDESSSSDRFGQDSLF